MKLTELIKQIKSDLAFHGGKNFPKGIYIFLLNAKFRLLLNYRLGRYFHLNKIRLLADYLKYKQITKRSSQISYSAILEDNIEFKHPIGIVIGEKVRIKSNVKIWQHVTIGSHGKPGETLGYPTIEEGVKIFAGAVIIGNITIGNSAIVAANSLINKDVASNDVVGGIPAKSLRR